MSNANGYARDEEGIRSVSYTHLDVDKRQASSIRRLQDNASDKFLEVVEATDVTALLRQLQFQKLFFVGSNPTKSIRQ